MSGIPTVIAFFGPAADYLRVALESAAAFRNQVVMIGDSANGGAWRDHVNSDRLASVKHAEFMRTYVKMSDYPEAYEAAFWRRPFAVESWMRSEGVEAAFVLDSDVVTFSNLDADVLPRLPAGCRAALMTHEDPDEYAWASSLHFSYWTFDALSDFTAFCAAAYRDPAIRSRLEAKYERDVDRGNRGGICEMTLLYFWRQRHATRVANLARVMHGAVGDLAVTSAANCVGHEYRLRGGMKELVFRNGVPYGFNTVINDYVRFLCVHCQGASKPLMRFLSRPGTQRFHRQLFHANRLASHARAKARETVTAAAALVKSAVNLDGF